MDGLAVVFCGALALALAGCSGSDGGEPATTSTSAPETIILGVVTGVEVSPFDGSGIGFDESGSESVCGATETGTREHMRTGVQAVLSDAEGATVSTADLPPGVIAGRTSDTTWICAWTIEFGDVPVSDFYTVTVDGTDLGVVDRDDFSEAAPGNYTAQIPML